MQSTEALSSFGHFISASQPSSSRTRAQHTTLLATTSLQPSYWVHPAAGLPDLPTYELLNVAAEARRVTVCTGWTSTLMPWSVLPSRCLLSLVSSFAWSSAGARIHDGCK